MERDFEKEFIQLKKSETPDLWNRIEAGLSDRKAALNAPAAASKNTDFSIGKINWIRWGTLAAACLCAAIIIPAISTVIKNIGSKNFSGGLSEGSTADGVAAAPTIDYESAGSGMSTENYAPADNSSSASAEDFILGDTAESEEAVAGGTMAGGTDGASPYESPENIYGQDRAETNNDKYSDNDGKEIKSSTQAATEKDSAETPGEYSDGLELKNGQEIEKATVKILGTEASGEETVYRTIVIEPDADDILKKDTELELVCNSDTEYDNLNTDNGGILKRGEEYEVSLRYEQDKVIVISAVKSDSKK